MDNFIRNENLKLYRRALLESSDEEQRRVLLILLRLLLQEEAVLSSAPIETIPTALESSGRFNAGREP
jgi:hypothetical protein